MLAFTTDELLNRFRQQVVDKLDDNGSDIDCLWSNDEGFSYMTEAVDRLAKDTEEWTKVLSLPVIAGQQLVRVPRNVFRIRQARLVNKRYYLHPFNIDETAYTRYDDYGDPHIGASAVYTMTGDPRTYYLDYKTNSMLLSPIPGSAFPDDIVEILAVVTIAVPMQPGLPVPFMDTGDQSLILMYMKHLAYEKQDADTLDLQRSQTFLQNYEAKVSDRSFEIKRRRQEAPIVRGDW